MTETTPLRCAVLSAVKHDYVARGVASHPQFELVVVADDPGVPEWVHERNQLLADEFRIPYLRDVHRALTEFNVQVAIVSSEAERHCDLSIRAATAGMHIVQDKPVSTRRGEVDRLVAAVEDNHVQFLLWNRNFTPAILQARDQIASGAVGLVESIHMDFYFAKDSGPPKGTRQAGYPPINWLAHQIAAHIDGSDGALGTQPIGELTNEGIYPLACIRMLTGQSVQRVFACAASHFHQVNVDNDVEDLASMTLELDGGIIGSVTIGRIGSASLQTGGEIRLRISGSEGALIIDESLPVVGVYYRHQPTKEPRLRRIASENDFLQAEGLLQSIRSGQPTVLDVLASREIFLTIEAAIQSGRSGLPVDVANPAT